MSLFYICTAESLKNEEILQVMLPDMQALALYRVQDVFYATADMCSHGEASLSEGEVNDAFIVECPWHGGAFDIRTGEAVAAPCHIPIKVYKVIVEKDKIYIDLGNNEKSAGSG